MPCEPHSLPIQRCARMDGGPRTACLGTYIYMTTRDHPLEVLETLFFPNLWRLLWRVLDAAPGVPPKQSVTRHLEAF